MPETAAPLAEVTITEGAAAHGVPIRSLQKAAERGQIPSRRIGNLYILDAEAVRLYGEVHKARRALDAYVAGTRP